MLDVPAEVQVMLDLTPEEMRELEAEFAKLPPTEQAQLEALSVEAGRAIARMNARLDETLAHLDRAFHNLGQIDSLTDAAARIFGSREAALRRRKCPGKVSEVAKYRCDVADAAMGSDQHAA